MTTRSFPLFKGATRVATVGGVQLVPLVVVVVGLTNFAMLFGIWWLALLLPAWLFMKQVTKADDRAFRILWLWMQTKLVNRFRFMRFSGPREFWDASTYATSDGRRRSWEGEGPCR